MVRHTLTLLTLAVLFGCERGPASGGPQTQTKAMLVEIAAQAGLVFTHTNGGTGKLYYPEIMGAGVALFDYDNDGDLDVYLVQGHDLDAPATAGSNRLFRNELIPTGSLRFEDVTDGSGVGDTGYGMGVAVGDYDGDGYQDLYVANFGANKLYRNLGDGRFVDVTAAAGAHDTRWSTSLSFADYDDDNDLDLFIANYEAFSVSNNKPCFHKDGRRDYCGPDIYDGVADRLLVNNGDGTFADVAATGAVRGAQPGLGVAALALDGESQLDFLVANDARANQLWRNDGGTFSDVGLDAGVAFNTDGRAEASMGIAIGDYDGDGDEDIFLSHLATETNTLYRRAPAAYFYDVTDVVGLGLPSLPFTGFGTAFVDIDNDSLPDLFVANGAVTAEEGRLELSDYPYEQRNQLFRNLGDGRFAEVLPAAEPVLAMLEVSRAAAFGDLDNDGDTDIVVTNNNGPVRLLRNDAGNSRSWLGIDLRAGGVAGEHARVAIAQGERVLMRRARRDGSYLAASDPRVLAGLGDETGAADVKVYWRGRPAEVFQAVVPGQYWRIVPGAGLAPEPYCDLPQAKETLCPTN